MVCPRLFHLPHGVPDNRPQFLHVFPGSGFNPDGDAYHPASVQLLGRHKGCSGAVDLTNPRQGVPVQRFTLKRLTLRVAGRMQDAHGLQADRRFLVPLEAPNILCGIFGTNNSNLS